MILYAKFICPGLGIKAWENFTARLEKFERGSTAQTDIMQSNLCNKKKEKKNEAIYVMKKERKKMKDE